MCVLSQLFRLPFVPFSILFLCTFVDTTTTTKTTSVALA